MRGQRSGSGAKLTSSLVAGSQVNRRARSSKLKDKFTARIASGANQISSSLQQRTSSPGSPKRAEEYISSPSIYGASAIQEPAQLVVGQPPEVQQSYTATVAAFGERVARLRDMPLVRAYPPLADSPITNADEMRGAIAIIARGKVPFVEKARRAQAADAVGVIFINEADEPYVALGLEGDSDVVIPVVCITRSDGAAICARMPCVGSLTFGDSQHGMQELEAYLGDPSTAANIHSAARTAQDQLLRNPRPQPQPSTASPAATSPASARPEVSASASAAAAVTPAADASTSIAAPPQSVVSPKLLAQAAAYSRPVASAGALQPRPVVPSPLQAEYDSQTQQTQRTLLRLLHAHSPQPSAVLPPSAAAAHSSGSAAAALLPEGQSPATGAAGRSPAEATPARLQQAAPTSTTSSGDGHKRYQARDATPTSLSQHSPNAQQLAVRRSLLEPPKCD
jgi:hypothetical protein